MVCGMLYEWVMSSGAFRYFFSPPLHPFFIDKIYTTFFSQLLLIVVLSFVVNFFVLCLCRFFVAQIFLFWQSCFCNF